jgi:uncharacterized protein YgbK (DUF1537 family)
LDSPIIQEKLLVITDDFTGATDTGVQFSKKQLRTIVITEKDLINKSLSNCDVLVIDTESRFDSKDTAYRKTFETGKIAKANNIKYIYKKLDSTFRGNIGAEISGIMDSLEIPHAIIVPALPSHGRTTRNGNVYVKGVILEETEVADDPKTPVKESYIPKIISHQTDKKTGVIHYDDVLSGKQSIIRSIQHLIDNGIQMIVIDAQEKDDLHIIASAIKEIQDNFLLVGSSGLAEYLPEYFDLKKDNKCNIIIAGSVSDVTRKQIDYVKEKLAVRLIDVEIEKLFTNEQLKEKNRIIAVIKESSDKGEDIIIRSASSKAVVKNSFEQGQVYGLDKSKVSEAIAIFLGEIVRHIINEIKINGILFTGGDIAIKAAQCLQVSGTIIQDEIVPGVPYGHFIEEKYKNITIVSKAGGFGDEDAIFQVLNFLKNKR